MQKFIIFPFSFFPFLIGNNKYIKKCLTKAWATIHVHKQYNKCTTKKRIYIGHGCERHPQAPSDTTPPSSATSPSNTSPDCRRRPFMEALIRSERRLPPNQARRPQQVCLYPLSSSSSFSFGHLLTLRRRVAEQQRENNEGFVFLIS